MAQRVLKIHPAIGVARLGNVARDREDCFFIGPETPGIPANWDPARQEFARFKVNGRIKSQAARFRIWEYVERDGKVVPARELDLDTNGVVSIEWQVHLANRKASFFKFQGRRGEADNFSSLTAQDLRNANVTSASERAALLEIDEGPKSIAGRNSPREVFRNSKARIPIEMIGELRTDAAGRLLVLGGIGDARSSISPPAPLPTYANNDFWFDDVADGPVTARVTLRTDAGGTEQIEAEGAWVLVGPPDFAPSVGNVITLYDALWDVAVRELTIAATNAIYAEYAPGKGLARLARQSAEWRAHSTLSAYVPSFTEEIFPLFHHAFQTKWVHEPLTALGPPEHHERLSDLRAQRLGELPGSLALRKSIFNRLRNPASANINVQGMPKAFGDDYDHVPPVPSQYLALTATQGALMRLWMIGQFVPDWTGIPPRATRIDITPEGLDRAALENCVGGAFYPGIEASWLIRKKEIFAEPFRIRHGASVGPLQVRAGFFSQQMALPWQADFLDCAKETFDGDTTGTTFHAWWPAQRPDDVFKKPADNVMVEWARGMSKHEDMVANWYTRGYVIDDGTYFFEKDGP